MTTFAIQAFALQCSEVSLTSIPTWAANTVTAEIVAGQESEVAVSLHEVGNANIGITWDNGDVCMLENGCIASNIGNLVYSDVLVENLYSDADAILDRSSETYYGTGVQSDPSILTSADCGVRVTDTITLSAPTNIEMIRVAAAAEAVQNLGGAGVTFAIVLFDTLGNEYIALQYSQPQPVSAIFDEELTNGGSSWGNIERIELTLNSSGSGPPPQYVSSSRCTAIAHIFELRIMRAGN